MKAIDLPIPEVGHSETDRKGADHQNEEALKFSLKLLPFYQFYHERLLERACEGQGRYALLDGV